MFTIPIMPGFSKLKYIKPKVIIIFPQSNFVGANQYYSIANQMLKNPMWSTSNLEDSKHNKMSFNNQFHTLGCEWTPNYVKFYYDRDWVMTSDHYSDKLVPMGFILHADADRYGMPPTMTLPYKMDINYIKVWKMKMDCSNYIDVCSFDPSTYDHKNKQYIKISRSGRSTTITSGTNVNLHASDYIEIKKNFTVEKGAEFSIMVSPCY
jgi:hypothetical protein